MRCIGSDGRGEVTRRSPTRHSGAEMGKNEQNGVTFKITELGASERTSPFESAARHIDVEDGKYVKLCNVFCLDQ